MDHKFYARILSVSFVFLLLSSLGSVQAITTDLASPNEELGGEFGFSVSGVPDVNGDGRGDVVVGAYQEDPGASPGNAGRVYIFDGATGGLLRTLASPNEESSGGFGRSVSGVSDVNGDGRGDVVVGALRESPGSSPSDAGRAYIFNGATGALLQTLASPNEEAGGFFGISVSGVSDMNGDGRGDVVIGAHSEDPGASPQDAGRAYIFSGASGALLRTLASPNEEMDGSFGNSVSGVPDVNGDSLGDVVIGAYDEDPGASPTGAGRAYVFDGATGSLLQTLASPNEEVDGHLGFSVSGVPDTNGDGRGDIVVGAIAEDPGASPDSAGRAYIFDGATGLLLRTLASPNEEGGGLFGWSVSGVSDTTGDGRGDVVIGALQETLGTSPDIGGRGYVFDGSTGSLHQTHISPNPETGGGPARGNSAFGMSVSGVSDTNGDGRGDVVIGAPNESPDASPTRAGRAYIFAAPTNIDVSPFSLDFAWHDINLGPSAGMVITITNMGPGNLTFVGSEVALVGTDPGEFTIIADSGQNPLGLGASRTVTVAFDPSSTGVKTANLIVTSDDPVAPTVLVPLSGEGLVASLIRNWGLYE